ncbi:hypothetical protein OTU49_000078 [Cherax quadricarinatus]|uniref:Uncharacterized protein n=1 Tax=Cherax quadricarinatus TaxID=27406 RepID=A0AAW0XQ31_CHEQU
MKTHRGDDEVLMTAALVLSRLVKKAVNQGWYFTYDWTQNIFVSVINKKVSVSVIKCTYYKPGSLDYFCDVFLHELLFLVNVYGLRLMSRPSRKLAKIVQCERGNVKPIDKIGELCRVLKHVSVSRSSGLCWISKMLKLTGYKIQQIFSSQQINNR